MHWRSLVVVAIATAAALTARAGADAIVVTEAMRAPTIAEVFFEEGSLRVELEIGVRDIAGFANLMPDEVHEQLGLGTTPIAERLPRFFTDDWIVRADGQVLPGFVERIEPRRRVRRDAVTGEPLPTEGDEEGVVFAIISYELPERPARISLTPPIDPDSGAVRASVGFVVYHDGLPVNDFRYLGREEVMVPDWDDPWYSRFENRNLRRRFDAPLSAFLYVDHFEVRKEVIVRPTDLQHWIDLGLEGRDTIPVAEQGVLKERIAAFLRERGTVEIDGRAIEPVLDRIHFVRRTLRTTGVVDPPEDMPMVSATLGVIFRYPVEALPDEVTMAWDLFSDRIDRIPAVATDEAGGLPSFLTKDDPVLVWTNYLTNPQRPELVAVAPPPGARRLRVPVISAICVVALLGLGVATRKALPVVVLAVAAAVAWPFARIDFPLPFTQARLAPADADAVVGGLLANVYRAFDHRDESDIYDVLARSADGDLLTQVYLEARGALELENQGGARARVTGIELVRSAPEPLDDAEGFRTTCAWIVSGSVGHWGHLHQRRNEYEADLTIQPVDGVWKITDLDLTGERRM